MGRLLVQTSLGRSRCNLTTLQLAPFLVSPPNILAATHMIRFTLAIMGEEPSSPLERDTRAIQSVG